jgi:hypothetical protein
MEEALVLTHYIKNQIYDIQRSNDNIYEKQKAILQYYGIMQSIESSLKELYDFYVKTDTPDSKTVSPIVKVINAIFSDIQNAKDINSKYVIDYWAEKIINIVGEEVNKEIEKEIDVEKDNLVNLSNRLKTANTDKRKNYLNKKLLKVNDKIKNLEQKKVTKENIKEYISGNYGDSNFWYANFMAALNSPNLLISGADMVIEQHYLQSNRNSLEAVNRVNKIVEDFIVATGKTNADKLNVEDFSKEIRRKATYDKLTTKIQ